VLAGLASIMKKSKLDLPFKNHTIIEEVEFQLSNSLINEIIIVIGSYTNEIEKLFCCDGCKVKFEKNPEEYIKV